jgi:hypothetical protein
MATIVLSAAGAALGGSLGGSVLGLSTAIIGRAIGATLGNVIDQRLLGSGAAAVETGRIERFRLNGASEGAAIPLVFGRMRVGGQVIWASRFEERKATSGGGKGRPSQPKVTSYSYFVSLAVALGEGEIARVGRVWADGEEIAPDEITMRFYPGSEDQLPDPKIEAVEGAGLAPAYRGTAYVVIDDLDLSAFGNRVPQFNFEVVRGEPEGLEGVPDVSRLVRGVAMMPGTGEYSLATTPVHYDYGSGKRRSANVHTPGGETDFTVSLRALTAEVPACRSASLIVSWFGDDLRCGSCRVTPKVEQTSHEGQGIAWRAGGLSRAQAETIAQVDGRPVYGGTPSDASVEEAIRAMRSEGLDVMFYPFLLMEQGRDNGLPDPWSEASDQPAYPWRGRITLSEAPGRPGSPDGTAAAVAQVAAFFGSAAPSHFSVSGGRVEYSGPASFGYRRFILHYAHLCAIAGGVESFCVGSEMRSLTQIRGPGNTFPAVAAFRQLAAEVRTILGPDVKVGYAADWSEYFGYQPQDGSGDVFFHLDPLWADPNVDFVGIDNYMPLSDWRTSETQADDAWGSVYNLDYLTTNIEGGEGFDWYYPSDEAAAAQLRTPITDGAHGEPWVYRFKDLRSWWSGLHHERIGGVRQAVPTPWVPRSKPFRFTEYGCPAVDRGTNEPNKFVDPKSSESSLPKYSTGRRDDLIQMQYVRAVASYWAEAARNPISPIYGGRMIDMDHAYLWAWDARPYPWFPALTDVWSDGANYRLGHWMTGRAALRSLASVVTEVCGRAGLEGIDTRELYGIVRGYVPGDVADARALLQPLMVAFGFDAAEREGRLVFRSRGIAKVGEIDPERLVATGDAGREVELVRAAREETPSRILLTHVEADGDFNVRTAGAGSPAVTVRSVSRSELPLALTPEEAAETAERWIAEARVARDRLSLSLPQGAERLGAGDVFGLPGAGTFRIDSVEEAGVRSVEAVRVELGVYRPSEYPASPTRLSPVIPPLPVEALFLDLPLLTGAEDPVAPYVAMTAEPWAPAAVYSSADGEAFALDAVVERAAVLGETVTDLAASTPGAWDRGAQLRLRLYGGALSSATDLAVLNGANVMAIGSGSGDWEVFQFARAALLEPGVWTVSRLLRGQAGTEAIVPPVWPAGSRVVLLDGGPQQIPLPQMMLGIQRIYRFGPARRLPADPAYRETVRTFRGVGLRPLAPVALKARRRDGDLDVAWIRRTRIDGDRWDGFDVPLGESAERYLVRVVSAGILRREREVIVPFWTYGAAARSEDGVTGAFAVEVAQISDRFGPGLKARIEIDE